MANPKIITMSLDVDLKKLDTLTAQLKQNILRAACRKAANVTKGYLKNSDVSFTGTYKKSISVKISARRPGMVTAVVGPRSSYVRTVGKREQKPVRYSFFLEKGSRRSTAREPIKKAFKPAESQEAMAATIAERIAQLAR